MTSRTLAAPLAATLAARFAAPFAVWAFLAVLPAAAAAQLGGGRRAFEPALTPWLGAMLFGNRLEQAGTEARYRSSVAVGVRVEYPLTRRLGVMVNAGLAPFSNQQTETGESDRALYADAVVYRADAGVSWRFKPAAPVFFYVGGGVVGANRYAIQTLDGAVTDPQGALGVGYDGTRRGRWNFRAVYVGYFVFPTSVTARATSGPQVVAKGLAYDWTIQLGGRYSIQGDREPPAP
jgi:hypothetical protein